MLTRIISGFGLFSFVVAIVLFNKSIPISLNVVIAIVSASCVYELIKVVGLLKRWEFLFPSLIVACLIPFSNMYDDGTLIIYSCYSLIMFVVLLMHHETVTFNDLTLIYAMTVIIPSALQAIVKTRALSENHGMFYALIALCVAWVPDVGAYFVGTFFGKHKLCPKISPKKTIEGLIGGAVFSMIFMTCVGLWFTYVYYGGTIQANYLTLILIGLGASVTSVIGDLSFSLIKRSCKVKDFGTVIPGHGGFLDRFDSVIFTAPFVFFVLSYISAVQV